jgi:hypothetical protein
MRSLSTSTTDRIARGCAYFAEITVYCPSWSARLTKESLWANGTSSSRNPLLLGDEAAPLWQRIDQTSVTEQGYRLDRRVERISAIAYFSGPLQDMIYS